MEAIDLVREHFASLGTRKIDVPEWKLVVHASPVTLGEKNRLYRRSKENDMELLVDILIMKATDEHGAKLFTIEHKPTLLNKADSNVVGRIANAILAENGPRPDDLKNYFTAGRPPTSSPCMLSRIVSVNLQARCSPCQRKS